MHFQGDVGLWVERLSSRDYPAGPALFLDRDGVVVEETEYLGRASDVRMIPGMAGAIASVNRLGVPVVLVTNQAGIGRGYYDWSGFSAVQATIYEALALEGAHLDVVLACAYHEAGLGPLRQADHPWRKPGPGMLTQARAILGTTLGESHIIGDKIIDLEAGANAGLNGGTLVATGHGQKERAQFSARCAAWAREGAFAARTASTGVDAIAAWMRDRENPAP